MSGFVSKQDRTIEDVIKKLPGIDVAKNGVIYYAGKPISALYIEGMNSMEEHPLGRAEWVKFMARFFGKEQRANFYFDSLVNCYQKLARVSQSAKTKPTVFSGKPYQGIWYVSPGNSYMAKLFADAGARYLFADKQEQGAIPLDFETVYKKAANADFWVMIENYEGQYTYSILQHEYAPFGDFNAFRNRRIVFCNTNKSTYYDEGMLQPDRLLADFIKAFHPELLPDYKPAYFSMLSLLLKY